MTAKLPLSVWADPGFARAFAGESGVSRGLEYEEDGRALGAWWDPRESGTVIPVQTTSWNGGRSMSADERERVRIGLWAVAREIGAHVILDESPDLPCPVAVAWDRPRGFLINVHDAKRIEYFQVRRTLVLPYSEAEPYHAVAAVPDDPRWTYPTGEPIPPDQWRTILDRLTTATKADMWIGSNLPWRITIAQGGRT